MLIYTQGILTANIDKSLEILDYATDGMFSKTITNRREREAIEYENGMSLISILT